MAQSVRQEKEAYDAAHPTKEPRKRKPSGSKTRSQQDMPGNTEQNQPNELDQNPDELFSGAMSSAPTDEPTLPQKIVNDTTTEALIDVLVANPAGLLCVAEELAGWIGGMDAYKARAGKDRAIWLQAKDGGAYTVNRKGNGVTSAPRNAVSIIGTIQDDKLASMANTLVDDGLLQRFALVAITRTGDGEDLPDDADLDETAKRVALGLVDLDKSTFQLSPEGDAELKAMKAFKNATNNPKSTSHRRCETGLTRAIKSSADTVSPST